MISALIRPRSIPWGALSHLVIHSVPRVQFAPLPLCMHCGVTISNTAWSPCVWEQEWVRREYSSACSDRCMVMGSCSDMPMVYRMICSADLMFLIRHDSIFLHMSLLRESRTPGM